MSEERSTLAHSRDTWRARALWLESEKAALQSAGDCIEIVEDDAGDLLMVSYGIHGYPIAIGVLRSKNPKWRECATKIDGDVRTAKRATVRK